MPMRSALLAAALVILPLAGAGAQGAAAALRVADSARVASGAGASLAVVEPALRAHPANYDLLWRASRDAVDLGEAEPDAAKRQALYKRGEEYARRAVNANAADAEGHFALSRALGRTAQSLGARDRVKYAAEVREHALHALKADPRHAGAMHVMGMWNAEVMRLSGVQRFAARTLLGGKVFGEASWAEAQRYMEGAVALEPDRITHRIDLAGVYADTKQPAKAREQLDRIARMPLVEANDARYKREAADLRAKLG